MFILPTAELKIIDPARMDTVPPEGREVGTDHPSYWQQHLRDGSIEIVPADKVAAAVARLEKADAQRAADADKARLEAEAKAAEKAAAAADTQKPADQPAAAIAPKK